MTALHAKALALACLASPLLVIGVVSIDAKARRAQRAAEAPAMALLSPRLPSSDLALSGGARWLRAPSVEDPSAAFADGPASPDPDPAGGAMAPPVAVWAEELRRAREARGGAGE